RPTQSLRSAKKKPGSRSTGCGRSAKPWRMRWRWARIISACHCLLGRRISNPSHGPCKNINLGSSLAADELEIRPPGRRTPSGEGSVMAKSAVILPAAGKSARFHDKEKKPFTQLDGRAVWLRTAELFVTRDNVCQTIIVIAPEDEEMFRRRFTANIAFMNVRI